MIALGQFPIVEFRRYDLITDSDNVPRLHALTPERAVTILPAVDPVTEVGGARITLAIA